MIKIITIDNENLARYVMFKLDKIDNSFTAEELGQIDEAVINYDEESESSFELLDELLKLKNIKSITLRNGYIYNDNYDVFLELKSLVDFSFENCEFENVDLITKLNLKSLSLINCTIDDYSFVYKMNNLEGLTIVAGTVEIKKLNYLNKLNYLQLSYSEIVDETEITINSLEELYIDNTNINNFDFLNNLNNLKRISISEDQYDSNKLFFDNLEKNNIIVLNENMVRFSGDSNEV